MTFRSASDVVAVSPAQAKTFRSQNDVVSSVAPSRPPQKQTSANVDPTEGHTFGGDMKQAYGNYVNSLADWRRGGAGSMGNQLLSGLGFLGDTISAAGRSAGRGLSDAGVHLSATNSNPITPLGNQGYKIQPLDRAGMERAGSFYANALSLAIPGPSELGVAADVPKLANGVGEIAAVPKAARKALQMVQNDLRANPQAFAANMARNPDLTFAEAAGPNAMTRVKALGNMKAANVGNDVAAHMADRVASTAPRINSAAERITGFDPGAGENTIDAIVQAGQAKAKPLYEAAYQDQIDSPALRNLIETRPAIRDALGPAAKNMRNQGLDPAFTQNTINMPDSLPTGAPTGNAAPYMQDVRDMAGGGVRNALRADGPTLNEFIASRGGIADTGGDLANIAANAQTYNRGRGLGKIIKPSGRGMDDMARLATDAGYFREEPSANDFMAAIDRELSGGPVRLPMSGGGGVDRARYLEGLQQRVDSLGATGKPRDVAQALANDDAVAQHWEDAANGLQGGFSPEVTQERLPTTQHLDYAKRALDDQIASALKNGENEKMRGLLAAKNDLVNEMTRQSSNYWHALDVSGDYLKTKAAFDGAAKKFMSPLVSPNRYEEFVSGLSKAEKDANLQGLLQDFHTRLNAKQGAPNSLNFLTSPNAQEKLSIAARHISPDAGQNLFREISNAAEIRANAQFMAPRQGSATMPLLQAERDLQAEAGMGGKLPVTKHEMISTAVDKLSEPVRQMWYRFRVQGAQPVLQEYARLLLQRGDLTVDEIARLPQGYFRDFLSSVAQKIAPIRQAAKVIPFANVPKIASEVKAPPLLSQAAAGPPRKKEDRRNSR